MTFNFFIQLLTYHNDNKQSYLSAGFDIVFLTYRCFYKEIVCVFQALYGSIYSMCKIEYTRRLSYSRWLLRKAVLRALDQNNNENNPSRENIHKKFCVRVVL